MRETIFTEQQLRDFESPLVYLFIKENRSMSIENREKNAEILYIGKGKNGLHRVFMPNHQALEARKRANKLKLYHCESDSEAIALEAELLKKYKPKYNKVYYDNQTNLIQRQLDENNQEKQRKVEEEAQILINKLHFGF